MKIYFIRHGHAEHNQGFEIYGNQAYIFESYRYPSLTAKGIDEIKSISIDAPIQKIYSSPLKRCIETSRIIFGPKPILYLYDGLMETQGPYPCNYRENYDVFIRSIGNYNLLNIDDKYYPTKIHETKEELKKRALKTLESIKADAIGLENIAIVTHSDWLESVLDRKFVNGEVFSVEY
jgi:broad specificity phosphatase PhoE